MVHWLADYHRKKILEKDFPEEWRLILQKHVAHYLLLNSDERIHLEELVQVFAHILDMLDGHADGVPPLHDKESYLSWSKVCSKEFISLIEKSQKGKRTFLDSYGATNEAEFFAVATEYFFDKPIKMKKKHRDLYDVLVGFYNQDTAAREKNHSNFVN